MADLSTDTLAFLAKMESELSQELEAVDSEVQQRKNALQAKLLDVHAAIEAVSRVAGVEAGAERLVAVATRRGRPRRQVAEEAETEWNDRLQGLNQRDAIIKIAQSFQGTLDVSRAAAIMQQTGKLQGQFAADRAAAEYRVAWLARKAGFKQVTNKEFHFAQ